MQDRKRQRVGFNQDWILIGKREKEKRIVSIFKGLIMMMCPGVYAE